MPCDDLFAFLLFFYLHFCQYVDSNHTLFSFFVAGWTGSNVRVLPNIVFFFLRFSKRVI